MLTTSRTRSAALAGLAFGLCACQTPTRSWYSPTEEYKTEVETYIDLLVEAHGDIKVSEKKRNDLFVEYEVSTTGLVVRRQKRQSHKFQKYVEISRHKPFWSKAVKAPTGKFEWKPYDPYEGRYEKLFPGREKEVKHDLFLRSLSEVEEILEDDLHPAVEISVIQDENVGTEWTLAGRTLVFELDSSTYFVAFKKQDLLNKVKNVVRRKVSELFVNPELAVKGMNLGTTLHQRESRVRISTIESFEYDFLSPPFKEVPRDLKVKTASISESYFIADLSGLEGLIRGEVEQVVNEEVNAKLSQVDFVFLDIDTHVPISGVKLHADIKPGISITKVLAEVLKPKGIAIGLKYVSALLEPNRQTKTTDSNGHTFLALDNNAKVTFEATHPEYHFSTGSIVGLMGDKNRTQKVSMGVPQGSVGVLMAKVGTKLRVEIIE